jgi:hypothetical protein
MDKYLKAIAKWFSKGANLEYWPELLEEKEIDLHPGYSPDEGCDHSRLYEVRGINPENCEIIPFGIINVSTRYGTVGGRSFYDPLPVKTYVSFEFDNYLCLRFPNLRRMLKEEDLLKVLKKRGISR